MFLEENVWMYSAPLLQQSGVVICPLLMSLDAAACAVAARVMGYPSFSEVILEQQLSPRAVAVMLRQSATKDGMIVAIIVLAASTARWQAKREGWSGETERLLALGALTNKAAFERAAKKAARIVSQHWQEIAAES